MLNNKYTLILFILISFSTVSLSQPFKLGYIEKVEIVNLFITVTDKENNFIKGLSREDFIVKEDGRIQEISHFSTENPPLAIIILLDGSGSMKEEVRKDIQKIDVAKKVALEFIDRLRPIDKCGLIGFRDFPNELSDIENNFKELKKKILFYSSEQSNTALYDAIYIAVQRLKIFKRERKIIVIISDGIDSFSKITYREALDAALINDIAIFGFATAGLVNNDSLRGLSTLEEMAKETGGKMVVPVDLNEIRGKLILFEQELFNVYSAAYKPSRDKTMRGTYHKLEVILKKNNYKLRYKRGYIEQEL